MSSEIANIEYSDDNADLTLPADGTWLAVQFNGVNQDD